MRYANGFYAVVVSIMLILIFTNLAVMRFGEGISLHRNVVETKSIISDASFEALASSIDKIKAFSYEHFPVLSEYIISDYFVSVYMKFYIVMNMIPLFLCFVLMGFSEGKLSRSSPLVPIRS